MSLLVRIVLAFTGSCFDTSFVYFFFSFVLAVLAGLPIGREQPFSHDFEKQFDELWNQSSRCLMIFRLLFFYISFRGR